jgi:hypothetical protein
MSETTEIAGTVYGLEGPGGTTVKVVVQQGVDAVLLGVPELSVWPVQLTADAARGVARALDQAADTIPLV